MHFSDHDIQYNQQLFFQYLFLLITYAFSFWSQIDLLVKCLRTKWLFKMSINLLINIAICAVCAFVGCLNSEYLFFMLGRRKDGLFFEIFRFLYLPLNLENLINSREIYVSEQHSSKWTQFYAFNIFCFISCR